MIPLVNKEFMEEARLISELSTCDRAHVGAVIVRGDMVLATGYNTSAKGLATCDEVGHLMIDNHCCRTIHAEANAIYMALKYGYNLVGATMYVTHSPCVHCRKLIIQSGIIRVIYDKVYGSIEGLLELTADVHWTEYKE